LIILTGAELFTGNILYMTMLLLDRKVSILETLVNWALSWIGNLMGALWFAGIFAFYGAIATAEPYKSGTIHIVDVKVIEPNWGQSKSPFAITLLQSQLTNHSSLHPCHGLQLAGLSCKLAFVCVLLSPI